MKPKSVSIGRTVNLGQYNTMRLEWGVELEEGEELEDVTLRLNGRILEMLAKADIRRIP